jgi:hypothetical protein
MYKEGTKEFEELMARFKKQAEQREADKKANDPYQIQRYMRDGVEWVAFSDYIGMIERIKRLHAQELQNARSSGYSDGRDSNYSWRL